MIICIAGPSGIGKTKASVELAKKYNAIIINADATQIYKELNIGSAKITEEEKEGMPHYLFDIKTPIEDYSVSEYQKDARKIIEENKDKNIIVIGGTGLYIKALFYDYEFKEFTKKETYDEYTNEELYEMAKKLNPDADLHVNNRVRLVSFLNREGTYNKTDKMLYDVIFIGLTTERSKLYNILDNRVDKMMNMGLLEEARELFNKYPESGILNRAIGYKELKEYFDGNLNIEEAKDLIKKNTRHYAKRQYTWFNNQMNVTWFDVNYNNFNQTIEEIITYIDSLNSK